MSTTTIPTTTAAVQPQTISLCCGLPLNKATACFLAFLSTACIIAGSFLLFSGIGTIPAFTSGLFLWLAGVTFLAHALCFYLQ